MTNFGAGHETLASTLTAVMAMLGTHPDVQKRAREEIRFQRRKTCQKAKRSMSYEETMGLDYTRAVIREAMRLYPVISMSLPREVPRHGAGLHLHGVYIPPGTTVGCNPISLHRNQDICGPDPDAFEPRRWLPQENESSGSHAARLRSLDRYNLSWGGGSRTCPGRHVAEMIVLKGVVRLLEHFEIEAAVAPDEKTPTYFLAMLTGVCAEFLPGGEGHA